MFFILLLALSALSIAGSAAFFSVYGLMLLFNGVSTFVLVMGSALELGKLVATSYLYRYWTSTQIWLKTYLILGIFLLMMLTSMGIFGILSVGYQTDSLPLKQIEQQTKLLDEERIRLITRKKQIDDQIANLPADYSKSRVKLMKAFKEEQDKTTERISFLDNQVLELKTKQIQTESHVGPIIYIAKAVGVSPDDATKWLIYLIIFVFDPMAVALTLAVNTAVKQRENENIVIKEVQELVDDEDVTFTSTEDIDDSLDEEPEYLEIEEPNISNVIEWEESESPSQSLTNKSDYAVLNDEPFMYTPLTNDYPDWSKPIEDKPIEEIIETVENPIEETTIEEPIVVVSEEPIVVVSEEPQPILTPVEQPTRRIRPYAGLDSNASIDDLINQFQFYKQKESRGEPMTHDELWSYQAIKDAIQRQGFSAYI